MPKKKINIMKLFAISTLSITLVLLLTKNIVNQSYKTPTITKEPNIKTETLPQFISLTAVEVSSQGYVDIFEEIVKSYENVNFESSNTTIFEVNQVDEYIQRLAINRGYKLRPVAIESNLANHSGHKFQPKMLEAWLDMQEQAKSEGINLNLISVYRSAQDQRNIFQKCFCKSIHSSANSCWSCRLENKPDINC
jgi:LAS superfamily LD-carboxypeptidase LdcB